MGKLGEGLRGKIEVVDILVGVDEPDAVVVVAKGMHRVGVEDLPLVVRGIDDGGELSELGVESVENTVRELNVHHPLRTGKCEETVWTLYVQLADSP